MNKGCGSKGINTQGHRTNLVDGPDLSGIGPDLSSTIQILRHGISSRKLAIYKD
jgi:hypothetical protein